MNFSGGEKTKDWPFSHAPFSHLQQAEISLFFKDDGPNFPHFGKRKGPKKSGFTRSTNLPTIK